jgi:protein-S-isoprenylcysteine O-methyltransferase Ste14
MTSYGIGWSLVILSTFLINHFDFTGLRQVYLYLIHREYTPLEFKQGLLYKIVRHPMMLGLLISFWATPQMSFGHLAFATGMTVYILIGLAFEEHDLLKSFGNTYQQYRKQVPMLIPRLGRKRGTANLNAMAVSTTRK